MASPNDFKVLFQSEELLVVDKPFDVAMDGDREELTVEKWVSQSQQAFLSRPLPQGNLAAGHNGSKGVAEKRLKFVHQLDYATSGVLCLAFSKDVASRLAHCFEMRYTKKQYLALVYGWLATDGLGQDVPRGVTIPGVCERNTLVVDMPVGVDESDENKFRMKVAWDGTGGARSARTTIQTLEEGFLLGYENVKVSKVLLQPESGRRHQLRVHTAAIGFPIVGDATYAADRCAAMKLSKSEKDDVSCSLTLPLQRMMLHAWRLRFAEDVTSTESLDYKERVEAKKKRRRETLRLEERRSGESGAIGGTAEGVVSDDVKHSEFVTEDPFIGYVVHHTPSRATHE